MFNHLILKNRHTVYKSNTKLKHNYNITLKK